MPFDAFSDPPARSTIRAELLKGRACERTGHRGRVRIEEDPIEGGFVVTVLKITPASFSTMRVGVERRYPVSAYWSAIECFNAYVGRRARPGEGKRSRARCRQPTE